MEWTGLDLSGSGWWSVWGSCECIDVLHGVSYFGSILQKSLI